MTSSKLFRIRPATETDQGTIRRMVILANLYPFKIDWRRFLLAEENGRVVGIGQVRRHADGYRELASVVVARTYRNRGIGTGIVTRLLHRESRDLFLCCREDLERFYQRVGFRRISPEDLPGSLAHLYRIEALGTLFLSIFRSTEPDLISMIRSPQTLGEFEPRPGQRVLRDGQALG